MTIDEREQLTRFLQMLEQAQAGPRDADADALIRQACARQPDAAYLLVQRVLQLEMAQQAQQAEVARLAKELEQTRTALPPPPSFLGGTNAWGRQPAAPASGAVSGLASGPAFSPASNPAFNPLAPAAARPLGGAQPQASSWGSGLMGTVASTAVGVVAGSMLYQGIGSLMGNRNNDHAATPPGGGKLAETDYANSQPDGGYAADDFDTGGGDMGDVG